MEVEQDEEAIEEEMNKAAVSRLEIEIKKNGFELIPIPGEHFLLLYEAVLQGSTTMERGELMMTNYRFLFFKERTRRVDLPFGLIQDVEYD
jgi:hypothetical protein